MSKFAKGVILWAITKKILFKKLPSNLLFSLYHLSKFEAASCNGFEISSFLCPTLQRAKKIIK